jgi:putative membrane protein
MEPNRHPPANAPAQDPLEDARNDPRVLYAAERTFLAWVRTGLALMGFGFVVARFGLFLRELLEARAPETIARPRLSLWVGTAFVLLGVLVHLAAAWRHWEVLKRLRPPMVADRRWSAAAVLLGVALAGAGVLLAGYLVYTR